MHEDHNAIDVLKVVVAWPVYYCRIVGQFCLFRKTDLTKFVQRCCHSRSKQIEKLNLLHVQRKQPDMCYTDAERKQPDIVLHAERKQPDMCYMQSESNQTCYMHCESNQTCATCISKAIRHATCTTKTTRYVLHAERKQLDMCYMQS